MREYLEAVKRCPGGGVYCPALNETAIGEVLAAREFQQARVLAWLGARGGAVGRCASAIGWSGPLETDELPACIAALGDDATRLAIPVEDELRRLQARLPRPANDLALRLRNTMYWQDFPFEPSAEDDPQDPRAELLVPQPTRVGECYRPGSDEFGMFARLPRYGELAAGNESHFGEAAEEKAGVWFADARDVGDKDPELRDARRAFGLHFLTDRFAAGHIRTPRGKLSNQEALRRHDFDNVNGLVVSARDTSGRVVVWRAYGDDCLLGEPAHAGLGLAVQAAVDALEREAVPGPGRFPVPHRRNPRVPDEPSLIKIGIAPAFGAFAFSEARTNVFKIGDWGALASAQWTVALRVERLWNPPALTQGVFLSSDGRQAFVPIAVDLYDSVFWLATWPFSWSNLDTQRNLMTGRHALARATTFGRLALVRVNIGWGLTHDPGADASYSKLYLSETIRWSPYERFALEWGIHLFSSRDAMFNTNSTAPVWRAFTFAIAADLY
jgi:hypothetical protein